MSACMSEKTCRIVLCGPDVLGVFTTEGWICKCNDGTGPCPITGSMLEGEASMLGGFPCIPTPPPAKFLFHSFPSGMRAFSTRLAELGYGDVSTDQVRHLFRSSEHPQLSQPTHIPKALAGCDA